MGTLFRIVLYASDEQTAKAASDSAFQRIDTLNSLLSDYLANSELNKLSATSGNDTFIDVSGDLYQVIYKAQSLSNQSDGAFDITIGPYVKLWRAMSRQNNPSLPDQSVLDRMSISVGFQHIKIDTTHNRIALNRPNMQLDLGGIAKGYAADKALEVLQSYGIRSALIDAGGDITLGEAPPGKNGWRVNIPFHTDNKKMSYMTLVLANRAVATSGDLFQFVEIDGERYSHIINPHTGLGITNRSTVTVIAPDGITADSYASALSVLGPSEGLKFIKSKPEIIARFEYKQNSGISVRESSGFKKLMKPRNNNSPESK